MGSTLPHNNNLRVPDVHSERLLDTKAFNQFVYVATTYWCIFEALQ